MSLPVTEVPGIGPARARALARLGIETVGGLLYRPPRDYLDLREATPIGSLTEGRVAAVKGVIVSASWRRARRGDGLWIGSALLRDEAGDELHLRWFAKSRTGRRLRPLPAPDPKRVVTVVGRPRREAGAWHMTGPDVEPAEKPSPHLGRIVPVYSLTEGLSQKVLRTAVWAALERFAPRIPDPLQPFLAAATDDEVADFVGTATALQQLHFPTDGDALHKARQRLAFDELLLLRLAAAWSRRAVGPGARVLPAGGPSFICRLPFQLTAAQRRAAGEIDADLSRGRPMQRLLQGDVGSGKTVVAAWALAKAAEAGGQGALVAPADVLARQHHATLAAWFRDGGIPVHLLTGGTKPKERADLLARLAAGEPGIVVGTHALLQPAVRFGRLDVVVVDEQHRFGVEQRRTLLRGPRPPHLLVVSATPIPRTLAHCVYGDLDVSVLDEMPPGRLPVDTRWVRPSRRQEVYRFVRRRLETGEQAFIVFPAIGSEEGEQSADEGKQSADEGNGPQLLTRARELVAGPFAGVAVEVVHGRQRPAEQEAAFRRFRRGEAAVLLATTVVEVGVDVPAASVIVIEDADKFGLAQLHQLRGRVGRGGGRAWCFLVADGTTGAARRRLQSMRETNDGFLLAQKDLELRGPGELLGVRQSGLPDVSPLGQAADGRTLELVGRWSERLLQELAAPPTPERNRLRAAVERLTAGREKAAGV